MKTVLSQVRAGVIIGTSFLLTVGAGITLYAAIGSNWTSLSSYEATSSTVLSSASWNNVLADIANLDARSVPTGTIIAYNGTSCPTGWTEAAGAGVPTGNGGSSTLDLRGKFIRGLNTTTTGYDTSRTFGSLQDGATKLLMNGSVDPSNPGANPEGNSPSGLISHHPNVEMVGVQTGVWGSYTARFTLRSAMDTTWGGASETRPINIALVYCVKN